MTTHAIQGVPHSRPSLSHHDLPSPFYGMFATRHVAQSLLVRTQLIQESRWDGHIPFQGVHHQLTDGIDLIGIGGLQLFPSDVLVGFSQHAPQKRQLLSHHGVLLLSTYQGGFYRVTRLLWPPGAIDDACWPARAGWPSPFYPRVSCA